MKYDKENDKFGSSWILWIIVGILLGRSCCVEDSATHYPINPTQDAFRMDASIGRQ